MDDDCLKEQGGGYSKKLFDRIRDIRASEKVYYYRKMNHSHYLVIPVRLSKEPSMELILNNGKTGRDCIGNKNRLLQTSGL
jgi:hypothetical protein